MKALKVSLKHIISANNIIEDNRILDNNLYQTASNYWIITGADNLVIQEITHYFGAFKVPFVIEEIEGA